MKTSFYVSRGTFRQNIVFEKKIQRIQFFSRDISDFWRDSLSWILNLPSTCPEEPLRGTKIGEKKRYFKSFFGTWESLCRNFGRKVAAELSKLHSTYPEYEFQEKIFSFQNLSFFDLPGSRGIVSGVFCENVYARLSNMRFTCSKECFGRSFFLGTFASQLRNSLEKVAGFLRQTFR